MARERALHAMGMGENLKAVLACDRDQRHAGGVRHAHRERRGGRDGDDHRRANRGGFLHHLDRDAAGQHDNALARGRTFVCKRAGKFVQRIVTTNILAHGNQATCWVPKTCGVYRTGLLIK